jgi:hypothetical protein
MLRLFEMQVEEIDECYGFAGMGSSFFIGLVCGMGAKPSDHIAFSSG